MSRRVAVLYLEDVRTDLNDLVGGAPMPPAPPSGAGNGATSLWSTMAKPIGGSNSLAAGDDKAAHEITIFVNALDLFVYLAEVPVGDDAIACGPIKLNGNPHGEAGVSNQALPTHFMEVTQVFAMSDHGVLDVGASSRSRASACGGTAFHLRGEGRASKVSRDSK